ncbi:MAG: DUF2141 domain-containing protein [Parvularculaceae bacterium]|nr:DUF2141 domain-containing protein [Parvularculaceae bacterium]
MSYWLGVDLGSMMTVRLHLAVIAISVGASFAALAVSVPAPELERFSDPESVTLAIRAEFPAAGGAVRVAVYDDPAAFLEEAALKEQAIVDKSGVAVVKLRELNAGPHAFVAYYDANGDGLLNRGGVLGKPKEPYAFSNGVKPKLRKPRFDEAAVDVAPGAVVVMTLED